MTSVIWVDVYLEIRVGVIVVVPSRKFPESFLLIPNSLIERWLTFIN